MHRATRCARVKNTRCCWDRNNSWSYCRHQIAFFADLPYDIRFILVGRTGNRRLHSYTSETPRSACQSNYTSTCTNTHVETVLLWRHSPTRRCLLPRGPISHRCDHSSDTNRVCVPTRRADFRNNSLVTHLLRFWRIISVNAIRYSVRSNIMSYPSMALTNTHAHAHTRKHTQAHTHTRSRTNTMLTVTIIIGFSRVRANGLNPGNNNIILQLVL